MVHWPFNIFSSARLLISRWNTGGRTWPDLRPLCFPGGRHLKKGRNPAQTDDVCVYVC